MLTHRGKISTVAPTRLRLAGSGSPSSSGHSGGVRIPGTQPASPPPSPALGPPGRAGRGSHHRTMSCLSGAESACTCPGLPAIPTPRPPGPEALGSNSSPFDMRSRPGQPAASLRVSVLLLTPEGSNNKLSPAPPLCQAPRHSQCNAVSLITSITSFISQFSR